MKKQIHNKRNKYFKIQNFNTTVNHTYSGPKGRHEQSNGHSRNETSRKLSNTISRDTIRNDGVWMIEQIKMVK